MELGEQLSGNKVDVEVHTRHLLVLAAAKQIPFILPHCARKSGLRRQQVLQRPPAAAYPGIDFQGQRQLLVAQQEGNVLFVSLNESIICCRTVDPYKQSLLILCHHRLLA